MENLLVFAMRANAIEAPSEIVGEPGTRRAKLYLCSSTLWPARPLFATAGCSPFSPRYFAAEDGQSGPQSGVRAVNAGTRARQKHRQRKGTVPRFKRTGLRHTSTSRSCSGIPAEGSICANLRQWSVARAPTLVRSTCDNRVPGEEYVVGRGMGEKIRPRSCFCVKNLKCT
jgi:hypothetical protein